MKPEITKPGFDEADTGQYHRARQFDPNKCTSTPKTIDITEGVKAVVCRTGGESTSVQSYIFDKDKFSPKEAKDWLEKHGKKALSIEFEDDDQIRVILVKVKQFEIEEAKVEKAFEFDKTAQVFIPFTKANVGQHTVFGYATTPHLDYERQKIDMAAIARALPEYLEWGNIRQMHKLDPVGVVLDDTARMDENGFFLGAKIVDADCWTKITEGVYKGFSIGIGWYDDEHPVIKKTDDAPRGLLTDTPENPMRIVEVSVVDRPANPKAKITAYKMVDGKEETILEKLVIETKKALPTFATNWSAGEMMDDLPKMVDTLFATLGNIIYNPEATADEKSAAMRQSVEEFSAKCQEYMTGEKLAKELKIQQAREDLLKKAIPEKDDKIALQYAQAAKKLLDQEKEFFTKSIEALKTEFTDKLKEATSTIGKLQSDKVNLEERLKKVEETPIPPKSLGNPDLAGNMSGAFANMGLPELQTTLLAMAKSADPKMQALASDLSKKLVIGMLGGDAGGK